MKKFTHWFLLISFFLSCYQVVSQNTQLLELRPGPTDGYDCEIRTDMDWPIWYEDDFIANAWTVQGSPFVERSLLKFDLSSLPEGAVIINANLSLFCNTVTGHHQIHAGENASYLLRITQPWDQYSVTWNTQPSVTFEDAVEIPATTSQIQDYPSIDVTNHIKYFYSNPDQNHGFMFQLIEEEQYAAMVFSSSDHLDSTKRPLLSIEYILCELPNASFSYSFTGNQNELEFIANETSYTYYWWDFGNGFYSDLANPIYSFPDTGTYNICLTVANECDTITHCELVNVTCPSVIADFSYEITGNYVQFSAVDSVENHQYLWDFGDGFFSYLRDPLHYFNELNNYQVCLTVSNDCHNVMYCDSVNLIGEQIVSSYSEKIKIYPNPSNGAFKVIQGNESVVLKSIRIINYNGTIILNNNDFRISQSANSYSCDLTGLESGLYTIQVITNQGVTTQKALVTGR